MASVRERTELIQRWKALLSRIECRSTTGEKIADWRSVLYAKVLRYLITRYEDERLWNRFAAKSLHAVALLPSVPGGSSETLMLTTPVRRPPKGRQEIIPKLSGIQAANRESYLDFGIPVE